ncbi:hypothetical protein C2L64_47050 [Paraburkholderia hospita]|jgi:hypothetical protein|uniref:DUF2934 domain-containing protein n=1 Tax=Paraburkholderia hospita TaxID=169430 RepID=A0AAN1MQJ3_9BURK|nr:DUF2934 domain-containing protein [Paraburkholderia hospita]AUT75848.1 hypothetical protein C2L64_47050 [Paraburkholderia hospita]
MDGETVEQRIRAKAYSLWQEDGSMEGCADEYWRKARNVVEAEIADEKRRHGASDGATGEGSAAAEDTSQG